MDAAYLFAKNFVKTRYEDLPPEVVDATKKEILDLLGVALGGANQPGATHVCALVKEWGGKEESSIIGSKLKVPAPNAAQANATMAHSLDFDDVHEAAVMHPGIASIPVVLAVGEAQGRLSGKEMIACTALGVDMMCRLALATTPGKSPIDLGWHLTSVFGFMGAAATAARVMGLNEETIVNAIGIGYHQSGGNGQCVKDGALAKRLGPGFAIKGGITAALLAKAGVTGAKNSLEGEWGFYRQYADGDYSREILTADLGERFEGVNVAIKPYPCCRGIHPAIDAALALAEDKNIRSQDIKEITLSVTDAHLALLCQPLDAKRSPRSPVDAQFSIPWGVASAIVGRSVGLGDFTDSAVRNPKVLEVTQKMRVEVDNSLHKPGPEPTRVTVKMMDGKTHAMVVENPLGSLERPMSFDDCARKFRDCAKSLDAGCVERVVQLVRGLDQLDDVREIIQEIR
ncbi:MAG TPA: MmgE/PrpD family protein [Acidobacteriota bacterium]|nr:MmgE/PrpD family protein [Acidobacteriota bacterium]